MMIALLILSFSSIGAKLTDKVTVDTDLGLVTGVVLESDGGNDFMAFRGIPYAKPPIKNLRFQDPVPVDAWNETLDATKVGPKCIQINLMNKTLEGDEDCLVLNVYVPRKIWKIDGLLTSVMVFIHGGGFEIGSGDYSEAGPQRFMDKDIVLVTINYRLGPYGFLSTNDEVAPGNYGLLDQVMALKWIQKHISSFGGDPNSVTIFGESAGSASVSFHVLSPLSRGLFHAAIHQSGNVLNEWACDESDVARNMTTSIGTALNCPLRSSKELIQCLREKPALDIIMTLKKVVSAENPTAGMIYRPVVDAYRGVNAFLPLKPRDQLLKGDVNVVPTISGVNKDESVMLLLMFTMYGGIKGNIMSAMTKIVPIVYPSLFQKQRNESKVIEKIVDVFFKDEDDMSLKEKILAFIKVFNGDWMKSVDDYNEMLAKLGAPVYPFIFSYRGNQSWLEALPEYANLPENFLDDFQIVSHADELQYLFHYSYFKTQEELYGNDTLVAEQMLTLWTNFAKTKRPTSGAEWVPMKSGKPSYYDINLKSKHVDGYMNPDWKLWKEIYDTAE